MSFKSRANRNSFTTTSPKSLKKTHPISLNAKRIRTYRATRPEPCRCRTGTGQLSPYAHRDLVNIQTQQKQKTSQETRRFISSLEHVEAPKLSVFWSCESTACSLWSSMNLTATDRFPPSLKPFALKPTSDSRSFARGYNDKTKTLASLHLDKFRVDDID